MHLKKQEKFVLKRPKINKEGGGGELDKRYSKSKHTYIDVLNKSMHELHLTNDNISSNSEQTATHDQSTLCYPKSTLPSPRQIERATSGMRGIIKSSKRLQTFYHEEQDVIVPLLRELLQLLEPLQLNKFKNPPELKEKENPEEFCSLIDYYTCAVTNFCGYFLENSQVFPDNECLLLLAYVLQLCLMIVAGRNVIDWQTPNDLVSEKGWKNWKNHLIVMISFAALLTSLQTLLTLCKRKWKRFHDNFLVVLRDLFQKDIDLALLIYSSFLT